MRRFAFRLAVKLGQHNVDAMLRGLTSKQLLEWQEYAKLEPFDELRADYRAAQIAQMVLMVNLGKGQKVPPLDELVLKWGKVVEKAKPKMDWRQMKEITRMIAAAYAEPEKS